ncbi:uncharacterized protein LOC143318964 [Chaetodon auriga]|uniref:uncharacterized protein LOC143318964 n=1 Tax=Chaetodon auriga TaxID=39042 RepID=UPI004032A36B
MPINFGVLQNCTLCVSECFSPLLPAIKYFCFSDSDSCRPLLSIFLRRFFETIGQLNLSVSGLLSFVHSAYAFHNISAASQPQERTRTKRSPVPEAATLCYQTPGPTKFKGIPENLTIAGRHRAAVDPRLEIRIGPRRVEWETGKFGYITKTPTADGSEDLRYDPTRTSRLKQANSVSTVDGEAVPIQGTVPLQAVAPTQNLILHHSTLLLNMRKFRPYLAIKTPQERAYFMQLCRQALIRRARRQMRREVELYRIEKKQFEMQKEIFLAETDAALQEKNEIPQEYDAIQQSYADLQVRFNQLQELIVQSDALLHRQKELIEGLLKYDTLIRGLKAVPSPDPPACSPTSPDPLSPDSPPSPAD